jgi:hypothetical protein
MPIINAAIVPAVAALTASTDPASVTTAGTLIASNVFASIMFGEPLSQDNFTAFGQINAASDFAVLTPPNPAPGSAYAAGLAAQAELRKLVTRAYDRAAPAPGTWGLLLGPPLQPPPRALGDPPPHHHPPHPPSPPPAAAIVERRKAEIEQTGAQAVPSILGTAMLALRDAGTPLDDFSVAEFTGLVANAFFAGTTSPSAILGTATWLVGALPEYQAAMRAEQAALLASGASPSAVTLEDTAKMPLLDALWREALVYDAIGVGMFRRAVKDTVVGGLDVANGTVVVLENPQCLFQTPDGPGKGAAFDPRVWLTDNGACPALRPTPPSFIPFGIGVRQCPGKNLATAVVKARPRTARGRVLACFSHRMDSVSSCFC